MHGAQVINSLVSFRMKQIILVYVLVQLFDAGNSCHKPELDTLKPKKSMDFLWFFPGFILL